MHQTPAVVLLALKQRLRQSSRTLSAACLGPSCWESSFMSLHGAFSCSLVRG